MSVNQFMEGFSAENAQCLEIVDEEVSGTGLVLAFLCYWCNRRVEWNSVRMNSSTCVPHRVSAETSENVIIFVVVRKVTLVLEMI